MLAMVRWAVLAPSAVRIIACLLWRMRMTGPWKLLVGPQRDMETMMRSAGARRRFQVSSAYISGQAGGVEDVKGEDAN